MSFRRRLLVFGYPALELLTLIALVEWIGLGWVLLILVLGVPIGFALMKAAGRQGLAQLRTASASGVLPGGAAGLHAIAFLGGLLIAIPGIWSKAVGLLLQLPPIQAVVLQRSEGRWRLFRFTASGDVIRGVVVDDGSRSGHDEGPAEAGPSQIGR